MLCFPGVVAGNAVHEASSFGIFILTSQVLFHFPKLTAFAVSETVPCAVFPQPRQLRKVSARQIRPPWPAALGR